jgi:bifunctional UDP-N-acetylglucosamine pyrophosphorylase/glucosamine-1-phosphate N-acetyltransferase
MSNQIQIIILAAGHGKRMNNLELPKTLIPLNGEPIIFRLLKAIKDSGVCDDPIIVVGQKADQIRAALGPNYHYIIQDRQLGTGHAVLCTKSELEGKVKDIMVLYGDHPLITAEMIQKLARAHLKSGKTLTMATVKVPDFADWRCGFYDFGRIVRQGSNKVCAVVEKRDATEAEREIKEVNPSYFCFKADWLWQKLSELKNENSQQEYYLTDLVGMACQAGLEIETVEIQPKEALGVNTAEQLELVSKFIE